MRDVILTAAHRTFHPVIHQIEYQRAVRRNRRVQAGRRLPGTVAHASDEFADAPGGLQRDAPAIHRQHVALIHQPAHLDLQPLDRRVDIAHRAARRTLFAHDVPGFERAAQFDVHIARREFAEFREAEFKMRREPFQLHRVAEGMQFVDHVAQVVPHEMRQHEAVVQFSAPALEARRRVGLLPEARDQRAQHELLGQTHARVRRHFEGAHLQQAEAAGRAVRREQLVDAELGAVGVAAGIDQQVAQDAVDLPGRRIAHVARAALDLGECDLDLVHRVVACLVDARRLTGRADEQAGEQIGQCRVVVPVADQAAQQVRPAQEGRIRHRGAAEHEVVTAAGAAVASVYHELLGTQAACVCGVVEEGGAGYHVVPRAIGLDVHLEHAGVGRDAQHLQSRVTRRLVAFEHHRVAAVGRGGLDRGHQFQVVLQRRQRRHEQIHDAVPHLGAQRGTGDPAGRFEGTGLAVCRVRAVETVARRRREVTQALRAVAAQAGERCLHAGGDVAPGRQRGLRRRRIRCMHPWVVSGRGPGLAIQRQPVAEWRIAGHQIAALGAQEPGTALPAVAVRRACQRQYVADDAVQPLFEHPAYPFAFERIVEPGVERIDVHRQPAFAPQVVPHVLVGGEYVAAAHAEAR